jgi:hypothetical protein
VETALQAGEGAASLMNPAAAEETPSAAAKMKASIKAAALFFVFFVIIFLSPIPFLFLYYTPF